MRLATPVLALALAAGLGVPARADEKLPPEQQAQVEAMLRQEGFTKWKEIELDDGLIEVDDAIDAAGKKVDLKLDPKTLAVVKRQGGVSALAFGKRPGHIAGGGLARDVSLANRVRSGRKQP